MENNNKFEENNFNGNSIHFNDFEPDEVSDFDEDLELHQEKLEYNGEKDGVEKIYLKSLNKKLDNIDFNCFLNSLTSDNNNSLNSYNLKEENEYLKRLLNEINNNDLVQDKIKLDKEVKDLTNRNKMLEDEVNKLSDALNYSVTECRNLKSLLELKEDKLNLYIDELNRYREKEKKANKQKIVINDILTLRDQGKTYREIAARYNVSASTIYYRINKAQK